MRECVPALPIQSRFGSIFGAKTAKNWAGVKQKIQSLPNGSVELKRRRFVKFGLGAVAVGGLGYWGRNPIARFGLTHLQIDALPTPALQAGANICVLTPDLTSGPYYINSPMRSNIAEDKPGLPLKLAIEIVGMPDCTAMQGLTVEIWHCDAGGYYSGYSDATPRAPFDTLLTVIATQEDGHLPPVDSADFLRGGQVTDANGKVEFETIFPGWYDPRVTHIHVKVSRGSESFLTTQLYFTDELVRDVYANDSDYSKYGPCPYNLTNDSVLRDLSDNTGVVLQVEGNIDKLTATVRLGIA